MTDISFTCAMSLVSSCIFSMFSYFPEPITVHVTPEIESCLDWRSYRDGEQRLHVWCAYPVQDEDVGVQRHVIHAPEARILFEHDLGGSRLEMSRGVY